MMHHTCLQHQFVTHLPEDLQAGILYISMEYATAGHRCCCGCGEEVITPFSPTDWKMTFDGKTVSLWPSVGNWNFACRSHYFIQKGRVVEADRWTEKQVEINRRKDKEAKLNHYSSPEQPIDFQSTPDSEQLNPIEKSITFLSLMTLGIAKARKLWSNLGHKSKS